MNIKDKICTLFMVLFISMNCAPITSDMQSAKTAGQGGLEITMNVGALLMDSDDEMAQTEGSVQDNRGGSIAYGIRDNVDVRARFESIRVPSMEELGDEAPSYSLMSFGIKYGILEDRLAFYLPYSIYNTDQEDTDPANIIAPTLLYTASIGDAFEITPSVKYLIPIGDIADDSDPGLAYNLGFGYQLLGKFTLRAEWGQYIPGGDAEITFSQTSFGLTYKLK